MSYQHTIWTGQHYGHTANATLKLLLEPFEESDHGDRVIRRQLFFLGYIKPLTYVYKPHTIATLKANVSKATFIR